jgi:hypothetical protein
MMLRHTSRLKLCALLVLVGCTCVILLTAGEAPAINNGLVPIPPMGANPFGYNELANGSNTLSPPDGECRDDMTDHYPDSGHCQIRISPASIIATANALLTVIPGTGGKTLADFGYDVIQLDGEWQGPRLNGELTPNPREFNDAGPGGNPISYTGDISLSWIQQYGWTTDYFGNWLHQNVEIRCSNMGHCLKLGIYDDWGKGINCTAGDGPDQVVDWAFWTHDWGDNGLWTHESTDATTFNNWGVSFVKIDTMCTQAKGAPAGYAPDASEADREAEWQTIRDDFQQYAPGIALDFYWWGDASPYSNIWRLGGDLTGSFSVSGASDPTNFTSYLENLDRVDAYARRTNLGGSPMGPGNLNDFDNLLFAGTQGLGTGDSNPAYLTQEEERSVFGLEALEASQLFIGADMSRLIDGNHNADLAILTSEPVINVDQDAYVDVGVCVEAQSASCPAPTSLDTDPSAHTAWPGGSNWEVISKVLCNSTNPGDCTNTNDSVVGYRAVGLLNRSDSEQDITFHAHHLRTNKGTLGAGLQSIGTWTVLSGTGNVTCYQGGSYCTAAGVPAHGLLLLEVSGNSDPEP